MSKVNRKNERIKLGRPKQTPVPLRSMSIRFNNKKHLKFVQKELEVITETKQKKRNIQSVIETLEEMKNKIESVGVVIK